MTTKLEKVKNEIIKQGSIDASFDVVSSFEMKVMFSDDEIEQVKEAKTLKEIKEIVADTLKETLMDRVDFGEVEYDEIINVEI